MPLGPPLRLILIGRSEDISDHDRTRLRWRSDRVTVNTHKVYCRTYDDLYDDLNSYWQQLTMIGGSDRAESADPLSRP